MPFPVIFSHRGSCAYQCCEQSGHSVCRSFGDYYTRLCNAAQAATDDPTPENLAALQTILNETAGLENG